MAKYIKKRKISLRDIIFKSGKPSRENLETSDIPAREDIAPNDIPDRDLQEDDDSRACSPESAADRLHAIILTENADEFGDVSEETPRIRHTGSNSIQTLSDESDKSFDGNKVEHSPYCSHKESDNNFIMSKYFDSLTVASHQGTLSKDGLPVVDTRSSRSLSAIPWSEINRGGTLTNSRSCYDICSNKIPGTPCGSNCSTPLSRRRHVHSPIQLSCSSRTTSDDDAVDVIPIDATTTTMPHLRREKLSRRMKVSSVPLAANPPPLDLLDDEGDFAQRVSTKLQMRLPSSLHVSPNLSPNLSTSASVSLSPLVSPTIPSDFSPFHPRGPSQAYLTTRPKSAQLPPLRGSASNPNLLHTGSLGLKKLSNLEVKMFSSVTRSNPNLYMMPKLPQGSSVGTPMDPVQAFRLTHSPQPTPPSSPRTASRGRRAPRVKVSGTISQDELDSI